MTGFIAMQRDALDHPLLKDADRFRAWFWLVAYAAWKPTRVRIKGETIDLQRGELSFSIRFMAESWGWSKSRVDRFISDLRDEGMIETRAKNGTSAGHKAGQGQSVLTICNYEKYQDPQREARDNDEAPDGTSAGQQRDKEEQVNKVIPNGITTSCARDPFPMPDWCDDPQSWRDFKANRKRKRLPNTPSTYKRFLDDIRRIADDEWPPPRLLAHAAAKGWGGIYDPRTSQKPGNDNRPQRGSSIASLLDDVRQVHGL